MTQFSQHTDRDSLRTEPLTRVNYWLFTNYSPLLFNRILFKRNIWIADQRWGSTVPVGSSRSNLSSAHSSLHNPLYYTIWKNEQPLVFSLHTVFHIISSGPQLIWLYDILKEFHPFPGLVLGLTWLIIYSSRSFHLSHTLSFQPPKHCLLLFLPLMSASAIDDAQVRRECGSGSSSVCPSLITLHHWHGDWGRSGINSPCRSCSARRSRLTARFSDIIGPYCHCT